MSSSDGHSERILSVSALREKHDPVATNLVTIWRSDLHLLLDIAEAAREYAETGSTADHARLNGLLDRVGR